MYKSFNMLYYTLLHGTIIFYKFKNESLHLIYISIIEQKHLFNTLYSYSIPYIKYTLSFPLSYLISKEIRRLVSRGRCRNEKGKKIRRRG